MFGTCRWHVSELRSQSIQSYKMFFGPPGKPRKVRGNTSSQYRSLLKSEVVNLGWNGVPSLLETGDLTDPSSSEGPVLSCEFWELGKRERGRVPHPPSLPLEMGDAGAFSRENQKWSSRNCCRPSLAGLWGEHASPANQSTPERTPPPQAHTPQRRTMDLPEAHAADGDRACAARAIPQHRAATTFQPAIAPPNE